MDSILESKKCGIAFYHAFASTFPLATTSGVLRVTFLENKSDLVTTFPNDFE